MKTILVCVLLLSAGIRLNANDGVPTGGWTDANGVNQYGSPTPTPTPTPASSSSSILEQAFSDAFKGPGDFHKKFLQNRKKQRIEREHKKRGRETLRKVRKTQATGNKLNLFAPFLPSNRTGNVWKPGIFDLKSRSVASKVRSMNNYGRKGLWN